jgi:hypothetical protein
MHLLGPSGAAPAAAGAWGGVSPAAGGRRTAPGWRTGVGAHPPDAADQLADHRRRSWRRAPGLGGEAAAASLMAVAALLSLFSLSTRVSLDVSAWRSTLLSLRLERPG